ncbi:hypothetical protein ABPG72_006106 [Tetrahymena utriculariae]
MQDIKQRKNQVEEPSAQVKQQKGTATPSGQAKSVYTSTYPSDHPLHKFKTYLIEDFIGGPKLLQMNWIINLTKGLTPLFVVFLMYYYQNFSLGAYCYLILHGSYGILWLVKDYMFPDKSFQVKQTLFSSLVVLSVLFGYWSIGWQILSGRGINEPSNSRITTCTMLYIFGVSMMLVSDAQKFYTLKYKQGLINEGIFARNRNPNYLGEMCVYGSFAFLTGVWESWIPLAFMWSTIFFMNMYLKDISLSRKQGGPEYIKNSYFFLFKVFDSDLHNIIFYVAFLIFGYIDYSVGGAITLLKNH